MLGIAVLLALVLSLGSGGPLDLRSQGVPQELAAAVANYAHANAVHLAGTFVHDGHPYRVDARLDKGGDSQGTVVADGKRVEYRYTGGHAYVLATQDYWAPSQARLAAYLAGKWVTGPDSLTDFSTSALSRSLALLDLARPGVTFTRRGSATRVNGVPAEPLSDRSGDLYVSRTHPIRFVRLVSSSSYRTPDGITDVRIDLDYPGGVRVEAPGPVVDTGDLATLPAQYAVEPDSFTFGACATSAGCAVSATVRNRRGPQVGAPTAEFSLTRADGNDLGRCTATIHPAGHDQTETVGCTVSGAAWAQFSRVGGRYLGTVNVHNPFYDG
ncbi:MAG TPA: hypothetical protein VOB72_25025 [Candidatus Dormibacteraeota bacterium]|nr:hypothetical protein [Candidatus Dormibacteraeota bacterium]